MRGMFKDAIRFSSDIEWNVENVVFMNSMFEDAENFNDILSSSTTNGNSFKGFWNVSNVIDFSNMFKNEKKFEGKDLQE